MKTSYLFILCAALLLLSGCDETKKTLGLSPAPPDEFTVIDRAPLDMPPNYKLRPPEPGKKREQEKDPKEEAMKTVFGKTLEQPKKLSKGELVFLKKVKGTPDPNIRQVLMTEKETDRNFVDSIMKKVRKGDRDVLDPVAEKKRLGQQGK